MLGAVGAGVALASAIGPEKAGSLIERVTKAIKDIGTPKAKAGKKDKPPKQVKPAKQDKSPKPFAIENV
ncbi:hypothetical protein [Sabulibacter ruber]|uniref:hypothetical protein n=1 Tax=Sabulibacter ruber TaxID=2811901 RepID=UPI001A9797B1|nr:hypothetical protein [Sabulibacter ruber]